MPNYIDLDDPSDPEAKHAEWVHYGANNIQCSHCGHISDDIYYEGDMDSGYYIALPHYCSNCGCKMAKCGRFGEIVTNRKWLNSLTNKELADFLTFGLRVRKIGTGREMVINQRLISHGSTLSDVGMQNWLSNRQEYEVWKSQDEQ